MVLIINELENLYMRHGYKHSQPPENPDKKISCPCSSVFRNENTKATIYQLSENPNIYDGIGTRSVRSVGSRIHVAQSYRLTQTKESNSNIHMAISDNFVLSLY